MFNKYDYKMNDLFKDEFRRFYMYYEMCYELY